MKHLWILLALGALGCATDPSTQRADVDQVVRSRMAIPESRDDTTPHRPHDAMTVADAVALALTNNPSIRADLEGLGVEVGELIAAGAVSNPELHAESYFPVQGDRPFALEFGLLQSVNAFVLRGHRKDAAEHTLKAAKAELAGRLITFAGTVREAAYRYIAARESLKLRRTVAEAADVSATLAERLHEAGNNSVLDVRRKQIERVEARLEVRGAERSLAVSRERLSRLMGLSGETTVIWEIHDALSSVPDVEPLPLETLETEAVASSLTLEAERARLGATAASGRATATSAWPHLAVGAVAEWEPSEGSLAAGPALELEIPIFTWGIGRIDAAEARVRASELQLENRALTLRSEIRNARTAYVEARDRARYLENVVLPLRREVTAETLRHYNGMYADPYQVLLAKRIEIDTAARHIEALRDYWVARAKLELALQGGAFEQMQSDQPGSAMRETATNDDKH